jgi:hypothetical protein
MNETTFRSAIEDIARQIIVADVRSGEEAFVRTPMLYPSGSTAIVRITAAGDDFFVTDFGAGYDEADMMGGSATFSRNAPLVAERAGIGFDHRAFFVLRATREQLPGAVISVANCSLEAVSVTAFKLAERKYIDDSEALYERLVRIFTPKAVARDASIVGASTTQWHVAVLVKGEHRPTIFEPVSNHHSSIFAASTKFHDIAEIEDAPARVAVVRKKAEFKTYLAVLSQAANVIERDASDETILRLAA